jgi:hypothetical protein
MEDAKTRLLALPNTPFRDEPMGLKYIPVWEPRGVRVDLMHESQVSTNGPVTMHKSTKAFEVPLHP